MQLREAGLPMVLSPSAAPGDELGSISELQQKCLDALAILKHVETELYVLVR